MKKKIVLGGFLVICVLIIVLVGVKIIGGKAVSVSDSELIAQFFGIQKTEYQIVNVENTLRENEYRGTYTVTINVKEEHMDILISEISDVYFLLTPEETLDEEIFVRNTTGFDVYEENVTVYESASSVKRKINLPFVSEPKTCMTIVAYTEPIDGLYEIRMEYAE